MLANMNRYWNVELDTELDIEYRNRYRNVELDIEMELVELDTELQKRKMSYLLKTH